MAPSLLWRAPSAAALILLAPRQDFIAFGSGEPLASEYHSFVLYHNNSPRWAELLKLPIPVDKFRGAHIRFEFRHCSSKCWGAPASDGRRVTAGWRIAGSLCRPRQCSNENRVRSVQRGLRDDAEYSPHFTHLKNPRRGDVTEFVQVNITVHKAVFS